MACVSIVLLLVLCPHPVYSAGTLDPSFGSGGKTNFRFSDVSSDGATDAVLQPDGKIVMVGSSGLSGQSAGFNKFAVARLNPDGSLDTGFGTGGLVLTDFNNQQAEGAQSVILQPDGKIVVGGSVGPVFAIARYTTSGALDTTFNGTGKVTTDFENSSGEGISDIEVRPDGKIMALGGCGCGALNVPHVALARYNTDGTLDQGFGNNGKAFFSVPGLDIFTGLALQPDGKVLVSGITQNIRIPGCIPGKGQSCTTQQSFMARYTADFIPDRRFGRRFGREYGVWGDSLHTFYDLYPQPDGRLIVISEKASRIYTVSGRLETNLQPIPQIPNTFTYTRMNYLVRRPNGKFFGCGAINGGNGYDNFAVAQYESGGGLIGTDDRDFFTGNDACRGLLVQPDGKVIVIGSAEIGQQSAYSFAVLRYLDVSP